MTDQDLSTMLREHVRRDEPALTLAVDTAIALGRRTVRRRRARRGAVSLALVGAAAAIAVPLVLAGGSGGHSDDLTGIDPATAAALKHYDAQAMPGILDRHARAVLSRSVPDLGPVAFRASDDQGQKLPEKYYDKASGMDVAYGGNSDHRLRLSLLHARSEAEGDARKNCANDLAAGYYFSCEVTISDSGDTVTTAVMAVRPLPEMPNATWGAVTREELRTGVPAAGNPSHDPIDPDKVFFIRSVESVHSASFLTHAEEIVRAPDLSTASKLWEVPAGDLETIVTDPSLVIPEPPLGEGNCPWTLPGTGVSCTKSG